MKPIYRILEMLYDGYQTFMKSIGSSLTRFKQGQKPSYTVITCSDSRVIPSILFQKELGSFFEIMTPGNILTEKTLEYVLFGVQVLKTPIILVIGHTQCGAIEALQEYDKNQYILSDIKEIYPDYVNLQSSDILFKTHEMIYENVRRTIRILQSNPSIRPLLLEEKVAIMGMVYNIGTGKIDFI